PRCKVARARLAALEFERGGSSNDEEGLRDYIGRFEGTPHAATVKDRLKALEQEGDWGTKIEKSNDADYAEGYLQHFPNGIDAPRARELVEQLIAVERQPERLERFLERYPSSEHRGLAQSRLATLEWQRIEDCQRVDILQGFVGRFGR